MTVQSSLLPLLSAPFRSHEELLDSLLARFVRRGTLSVTLPSGRTIITQGTAPGPLAALTLHHPRALRRILFSGALGFAEGYLEREWDSPDLTALLRWADMNNRHAHKPITGASASRLLHRLYHRFRDNSKRGSRRNISAHYDLGNAFYRQWLDPTMTYSAALFTDDERALIESHPDAFSPDRLAHAQERKYHALARDLGLAPGMTVLEIGCGWGGFAEVAARDYGAKVVGLTLSHEQLAWAKERLEKAGLAEQCDMRLQDYRDCDGQFDRIVSVEMIEAVGERWWPTYFQTLRDRLKPGGKAALQAITIDETRFDGYRQSCDFIQRYVFPGGMLPSPEAILQQAQDAGMTATFTRRFGIDYERTLTLWGEAFAKAWPTIAPLGFDDRFYRLWLFYLAYCRAGFLNGAIDVCHVTVDRP